HPASVACGQFFICELSSYLCFSTSCLWVRHHSHLKQEDWPSTSLALISSFTRNQHTIKKMSDALCIAGSLFGSAQGQQDCGSCYMIYMGSVVGIIASDIILTIFITISVFCFATHHKRRREWDSRDGKRNLPSSVPKKMATEVTESPYQELHGVQSDVYSELRHFRK
ncbi:TYRO protein tyrosine kinase-binding protein, partial [Sebastes umbrosus]|uniref:TYRO protein tyrosine kinase-binding protein n=1 Tax=Sebastes umbrosus TaxID=72105 RepID=UPI0018A05962